MVTDPIKNIYRPVRHAPAFLRTQLLTRYVEAEVRLPAFARIYQAASEDLET